jgi:hypothetical protein
MKMAEVQKREAQLSIVHSPLYIHLASQDGRSGDDGLMVTPVPIPNTTVKHQSADGTAGEALWESRLLPG